jgi:hypothetical protein
MTLIILHALKSFDLENRVRDIAQLNARIKELANGGHA